MSSLIYLHPITSSNLTTLLGYFPENEKCVLFLHNYGTVNNRFTLRIESSMYNAIKFQPFKVFIENVTDYGELTTIEFKEQTPVDVITNVLNTLSIDDFRFPCRMMVVPSHYNTEITAQGEWYINDNKHLYQRINDGTYRFVLSEDESIVYDGHQITEIAETANNLKINILWPTK